MLSPNVGRPSHPVDVPRPIRNTPVPLSWFFLSESVFAHTHETYASFCIMTRGASPLLRWASSGASPLSSSVPRTPSSGLALSPLPWIPAVITPLLHRHQNGGWVHPTVRGGRTLRLLLFLLWRLRCRHVVLRYTARQLTSRMAAIDGGDNWPCQNYDSTFILLHDSLGRSLLVLYISYRITVTYFRSRWKPRFQIRFESNPPWSFKPLFPTIKSFDISCKFNHNTTDRSLCACEQSTRI